MTDETPRKTKNRWKLLLKIAAGAGLFLFVIFSVLASLGGNGDNYRKVIKEYLSETTGYYADVKTLNEMRFFPDIGFDFEGLALRALPHAPQALVTADSVKFAVGFWDVMFSAGKMKQAEVRNLSIGPGVLLDAPVLIRHLGLTDRAVSGPALETEGKIGAVPFSASFGMEARGGGESRRYGFGKDRPSAVSIGPASVSGMMRDARGGLSVSDLSFFFESMRVVSGAGEIKGIGDESLSLTGELTFAPYRTVLNPDITLDVSSGPPALSGTLAFQVFDAREFAKGTGLRRGFEYVRGIFSRAHVESARHFTLSGSFEFSAAQTLIDGADIGPARGRLSVKDGAWSFESDNAALKAAIDRILSGG